MKKLPMIIAGMLMVFVIGCTGTQINQAPVETVEPQASATVALPTTALPVVASDAECVKCHTDKDTLILTAKEEEVVEEESEGAG